MGKVKYIHIGMPKNLSTTIQRDFFDKHPEIMHLGIGIDSNVGYINPQIGAACENHLQYSKRIAYKAVRDSIKSSFKAAFAEFQKNSSKNACGISLELLSFTFTPDQIEIEEKVERVHEIFGDDTKIILIIRNQFKLIESLYKEAVRMGYYGNFSDYLEFIYILRDRNFVFDFQYDYLYNLYSSYFGASNIYLIPIETVRGNSGELIYQNGKNLLFARLAEILNVSYYSPEEIGHYNKPLTDGELLEMIKLNKVNIHNIGNSIYGLGTNFHRLKDYFSSELNLVVNDEKLYGDARIKNQNIVLAKQSAKSEDQISFEYPPDIHAYLFDLYNASNLRLQELLNFKLPSVYFED